MRGGPGKPRSKRIAIHGRVQLPVHLVQIGTMTVPNRIAETTHAILPGRKDGPPDADFILHHVQKACHGVGWIGSETWFAPTPLAPGFPDEIETTGPPSAVGFGTIHSSSNG